MSKLIIADTSCLIVLEKIERLDLLKSMFEEIVITEEVRDEFREIKEDWIKVINVKDTKRQQLLEFELDKGEASAIALALENEGSTVLIDERKGRKIAEDLGIKIKGTLGVLVEAKLKNKIDSLFDEIMKLKNVEFRMSEKLIQQILEQYEQ